MGLSAPDRAGEPDACEREPIHIPGTIQPHGVLLSVDPRDWTIAQVSVNSASLLNEAPEALTGQPLSHLLEPDTVATLAERDLSPVFPHLYDSIPVSLRTASKRPLGCIAHFHDGRIILEFEEPSGMQPGHTEDLHRRLSYAVGRIARSGDNVTGICDTAVTEMHELTGFDHGMVDVAAFIRPAAGSAHHRTYGRYEWDLIGGMGR